MHGHTNVKDLQIVENNLFGHEPGSAQFYAPLQPRLQVLPNSLLTEGVQFT
jgi:hypothetical protein